MAISTNLLAETSSDLGHRWPDPGVMAGTYLFECQVASLCESWRMVLDQIARAGEFSLRSSETMFFCLNSYRLTDAVSASGWVGGMPGLNPEQLERESNAYAGTGGTSDGARGAGFVPAFYDTRAKRLYRSRFADGSPAPMHILDGLPTELVKNRDSGGRVTRVSDEVVSGFEREGQFFTREMAARELDRSRKT